ncbi:MULTISPECIES: APC family permease [Gemmobacter]|jgi:ethanolamine permease|uniref:Amino acid/polyamine/organocation transporter (APC superfamily) n=2 Tax=Gemmobacter TaxID=204456 RepID=A0A2T6B758_9RHOB|nr:MULTISPECIES: amino acid permease [Gemmobacter]OJY28978.1 MAG: transporter [Rhodobacterales bacterium 65-51]PTX51896.1 amino acid/polyamine/organocation transporter (APC superfamily) [Gemmobacter caeni]TWJ04024.1 ethanolamine permease [Gemmobacter caeni]GHC10858.1 putative transporter R00093 [Gemmobacter nanjingensis]
MAQTDTTEHVGLARVLGPAHVWALGVGIVLVGEYMGWNFAVGKGGAYAALMACWFAGILYTCVAMIDSEVTSTVAAAGGQYTQAKHIVGPLMAFNVGLYLVFAYTMLEAANAITVGFLVDTVATMSGHEGGLDQRPFIILAIMFLAWLNYRGVLATLTFNLVITAIAFTAIIILFLSTSGILGVGEMNHAALMSGQAAMPYGWLGVLAAMHFGLWYYLGIEGTTQAAEEVRSPARALPFGTLAGVMTLAIAATLTWYVCAGLMPWEYLGQSGVPLFDAARLSGSTFLMVLLGIGTLFATLASANGCINDASRAWFAMGRDKYLPGWFGAVHPKYRTPYRAIIFLVPIALIFALGAPLDQVITFSILSGLLEYTFMPLNIILFRRKWPLDTIKRGYEHPFHPLPAMVLLGLCGLAFFAVFLGYGTQLVAMIVFYIVVSLWFHFWRYRFVNRGAQFTMPWPKPRGY